VAVLRSAGVERLIDVRRFPASRRHPHFARDALAVSLPVVGIAYDVRGDALGGRRRERPADASRHPAWRDASFRAYADHMDTAEFRDACEDVLVSSERIPSAVMCAETLWWRCHRRLIADAAVLRGYDVTHLGLGASVERQDPHRLHPAVRRGDDGWPVYDVGEQLPLTDAG
jgi:uncharacterized protein (DUF488 family)